MSDKPWQEVFAEAAAAMKAATQREVAERPADAAMLRDVANGFDSGEYQSSGNDPKVFDIAARLRALADVLEAREEEGKK